MDKNGKDTKRTSQILRRMHLLRCIRDNKNLGLRYYSMIEDSLPSDILRQDSTNTEKQLLLLSIYIWQYWWVTCSSTGAYIVFYQGGPICHCTHVPGTLAQSSAESEYSSTYTAVMDLANFMIRNNVLLEKDPGVVSEQAHFIILYSKYYVCMYKNVKDTKHIRHISRRMHIVINCEDCKLHNIVWF